MKDSKQSIHGIQNECPICYSEQLSIYKPLKNKVINYFCFFNQESTREMIMLAAKVNA